MPGTSSCQPRPEKSIAPHFRLSLPPSPTATLAGAFVIRDGFVASFSNPSSAMHESVLGIHLLCHALGRRERAEASTRGRAALEAVSGAIGWCILKGERVRKARPFALQRMILSGQV